MARFKASRSLQTPLRIQLGTTSSGYIEVVGVISEGENSKGIASRPVLSRPSTPGKGTGVAQKLDPRSPAAMTAVVTNFNVAPSYPSVDIGSFNLPQRVEWRATQGNGCIVGPSDYVLFYAFASNGHTMTGEIEWEEQ